MSTLALIRGWTADTVRETYFYDAKAADRQNTEVSPNVAFSQLGKKWRAERNFWISFMCFFLWLCVPNCHTCICASTPAMHSHSSPCSSAAADT